VLQGSSLNGGLHLKPFRHGTLSGTASLIGGSQENLDDIESVSTYAPSISAGGVDMMDPFMLHHYRNLRTTSSNDNIKSVMEEDSGHSTTTDTNSVQSSQLDHRDHRPVFSLGGESPMSEHLPDIDCDRHSLPSRGPPPPVPPRAITMVKSYSHDHTSTSSAKDHAPPPPTQHSNSESALDLSGERKTSLAARSKVTPIISIVPSGGGSPTSLDEETNSTDSGSIADDEAKKGGEKKKRFTLHMLRKSNKHKSS